MKAKNRILNYHNLPELLNKEQDLFRQIHPHCALQSAECSKHFLYGVPLHWMSDWPSPHPLSLQSAQAAHFSCADQIEFYDFCLGDTGAMFGHSPPAVAQAIAEQAANGLSAMLPGKQASQVGELLAANFAYSHWQLALSASDANRFVLRWARAVTERKYIVVFDGCYHGTVDDTLVDLVAGEVLSRASLLGQAYDLAQYTRVVDFNDLPALEKALADGQVACVLTEPALTNSGMVLPDAGFLTSVRRLTAQYGSLLVLDETHTISVDRRGAGRAWGVEADFIVLGKPIAGGLPAAVYGFSQQMAERMLKVKAAATPGHSGIGTTLSGNSLTLAAIAANLSSVMTIEAYQYMHNLCSKLSAGLRQAVAGLPWCITQLGARCEFQFCSSPPKNAREALASANPLLEHYLHLYLLNRRVMITPFHNMILLSPVTSESAVAALLEHFTAALVSLEEM